MINRNKSYKKKEKITYLKVREEAHLIDFIISKMGGMKRNSVKSLFRHRQISVNNEVVTQFDYPLKANDSVTINTTRGNTELQHPLLKIIYEDRDFIVVDKKEGLLTVTTGNHRDITAFSILKNYVKKASPKNKIYTVHRLDRETSGVLLFSKNRDLQHELRNNWHTIVKKRTYIALVEGKVEKKQDYIMSWLKEEEVSLKVKSSSRDNGGKQAVTHYKRINGNNQYSLLEIELETGRRNQIRSQLEFIGHPIAGDKKYGSTVGFGRVALHAHTLEFLHPTTGKRLTFESSIPKEFTRVFRNKKGKEK